MFRKKQVYGIILVFAVATFLFGAVLGIFFAVLVLAEGDLVPAINTATDQAVIVSETALAEASVLMPVEIVVEATDGAFFLLTSESGADARELYIMTLAPELTEQLRVDFISIANYQSFSVVEVPATADEVEPILQDFIDGCIVGVYFLCRSAYSFAW